MKPVHVALTLAVVAVTGTWLAPARGQNASAPAANAASAPANASRPAPKALSEQTLKGLQWLAKQQLENGAWGQGEESSNMGGGAALAGVPNVADTCMAVLAMMRSGSSAKAGPYKENINRAVAFICSQVDASDEKSLYVVSQRGTRTQQKLGQYIDTFLAAQVLGELHKNMADDDSNKMLVKALDRVVGKIELNQKDDGKFASDGWAPTIMQGQAAKAVNAIVANGGQVDEGVRQKLEINAQRELVASGNSFAGSGTIAVSGGTLTVSGNAGVDLYSKGANLTALQNSENNNDRLRQQAQAVLSSPTATQPEKDKAKADIERFDRNTEALKAAQSEIVAKMGDDKFINGFGSNGGEEFLSYLNIGESLFQKGGEDWTKWDKKISDNLNNVQNADGSWSGHHCITGRTFCTSAALMVLMIDRSPAGTAAKLTQRPR